MTVIKNDVTGGQAESLPLSFQTLSEQREGCCAVSGSQDLGSLCQVQSHRVKSLLAGVPRQLAGEHTDTGRENRGEIPLTSFA